MPALTIAVVVYNALDQEHIKCQARELVRVARGPLLGDPPQGVSTATATACLDHAGELGTLDLPHLRMELEAATGAFWQSDAAWRTYQTVIARAREIAGREPGYWPGGSGGGDAAGAGADAAGAVDA